MNRLCRFGSRPFAASLLPAAVLLAVGGPSADAAGMAVDFSRSLWSKFEAGGDVMYVILAFSVVGLALTLEAAFQLRRNRILPLAAARGLQSANPQAATEVCLAGDERVCLYRVLQVGHRWRNGTTDQIQAAIEETVDGMRWRFRRTVRPIGIIANTAPLLGLLGTVLGITQCFDVVARKGAMGDPTALSGGISQALLTTCFGLMVAIPMLLAYHYFVGRIDHLLKECEELAKEALILPPPATEPAASERLPSRQL